jgi:UDP-N-acetylmuramate dehydrogenase
MVSGVDPAELEVLAAALGPRAKRDHPLGRLTTYRVGGHAAVLVEAGSEEDLVAVRTALSGRSVPVLVLGKGSNLLVADAGFPGLVVRMGLDDLAFAKATESPGPVVVRAGSGIGLPVLARRSVEAGLTGFEWAVGVPGSVGGAVRMNAGGHGSDVAASLVRYRWLDLAGPSGGEDRPQRLALGYRSSSVGPSEVVVWAEFALSPGDRTAGRAQIADIVGWRRRHQPGGSNAGSVFSNPPGDSAGRLVEAAGLKGFCLRSARVSDKHANFIQADDDGSADDVAALIDHVRTVVADRFGVVLRPEVRLIGFPGTDNGGDGRNDDRADGAGPMSGSDHETGPGR